MNSSNLRTPLSNVQIELLRVFSHQLDDKDLESLKKVLATFFAELAITEANKTWDQQAWSQDKVDELLNTKLRRRNER